jgi:hypothetical protein
MADAGNRYAHYRQAMLEASDADTALALAWDVLEAFDQALCTRRKNLALPEA